MVDAVTGIGAGGMTRVDYLEHMLAAGPSVSSASPGGEASGLHSAATNTISGLVENNRTYAEGLSSPPARALTELLRSRTDGLSDEMGQLDAGGRLGVRQAEEPKIRDISEIMEEQGRQAMRIAEVTIDAMDKYNHIKHATKSIEVFANLSNGARNSLNTLLRG
ncbi:MAG: hypothetical protein LPL00_02620 [Alphaproteobacteria bacterium]|nr:hypothetical protein [Alphaproteobacteria bacterium]MDX5368333.1 hypothetical protein [Alphaproteobacteria bacterium]MDX5463128.1 hypothetical protein [Alphaproteobacteria bacterium]